MKIRAICTGAGDKAALHDISALIDLTLAADMLAKQ